MAKKSKKTTEGVNSPLVDNNELYEYLFDSVNALYKDKKLAFNLATEQAPSDVTEFIDTGNIQLNMAVSNRVDGGWPLGRIVEFVGAEGSGKSLLAIHALKSTQDKGGIAILLDTENAFNREFAETIGLDVNKLIYSQPDTIEETYEIIEHLLTKLKQYKGDKIVTIVFDSAAGVSSISEIEGDYGKDGWATTKAIINSKAMRKITNIIAKERALLIITNQLRDKLGVTFGETTCVDPFTTKIKIRYKLER